MSSSLSGEDSIVSLVIGTAGHIDHGKSSLVRRLTGVDPDRLKEEKERELTIDLGFAPLQLPDGSTVGIIDVPGHERFVKNMVAGATGIDLVVLVVAADDGVMPQTREHLEILTLLGLKEGLVVITKIDLSGVDEELVEILELELEELLEGTFLQDATVCRVDSLTGRGFDTFKQALITRIQELAQAGDAQARAEGAFRLPIQRVFSARGFGTIVTGVPLSGTLEPGAPVEVISGARTSKGRIRGLQAYGRKVGQVRAGHSSALNISDVDYKLVTRGDTVCSPGIFAPNTLFEARLSLLPSQVRPLHHRQTVRVHLGTSEVLGEIVLLDRKVLNPREDALCQLRLRTPLVACPNDQFVIRRHSPMETLGGGTLLGASRWRLKPFKGFVLERLGTQEQALGDQRKSLLLALDQNPNPTKVPSLVKQLNQPKQDVMSLLEPLLQAGQAVEVSGGKGQPVYVSADGLARTQDRVVQTLTRFHTERPLRDAFGRLELRGVTKLPDGLLQRCLDDAVAAGLLCQRPPGYALATHQPQPDEIAQAFLDELLELYQEDAFATPTRPQALDRLGREGLDPADADDLFQNLLDRGELTPVGDELVFHTARYEEARQLLQEQIKANGPISAATFKEQLSSSRRYTIPLLEHFDEIGLTRREGNVRVLR